MRGGLVEGERPGQLFKDLVEMYNKKDVASFKLEWHFDKRSVGREKEYLDVIKDELKRGKGGRQLRNDLRFAGDDDGWGLALRGIFGKLDEGFIKVVTE